MTYETTCSYCEGSGTDLAFGGKCSSCNGGAIAPTSTTTTDATIDAQAELAIWLGEQTWSSFAVSLSEFFGRKGYLSEKQMKSALSMKAKCDAREATKAPEAPKAPSDRVQGEGMFRTDDGIFKVQSALSSGNLYAKKLEGTSFEYAAGAIRKLKESDRMSLEEAQEFGRVSGTCCVCSRKLNNEESIADGIGPVCKMKNFWMGG